MGTKREVVLREIIEIIFENSPLLTPKIFQLVILTSRIGLF